jgi:hypothetical protein
MIDDVCALIAEAEAKGLQGAVLTLDQLRAVQDRLRAAEAERDRLLEAVNLFVPEPTWWGWSSEGVSYPDDQMTSLRITFGQVRRARKLVEGGE